VWISERKDVLSLFFCLLGLLAYTRHVEKPNRHSMAFGGSLPGTGLMAKRWFVSFPVVLLLLDFWPCKRAEQLMDRTACKSLALIREKIPPA